MDLKKFEMKLDATVSLLHFRRLMNKMKKKWNHSNQSSQSVIESINQSINRLYDCDCNGYVFDSYTFVVTVIGCVILPPIRIVILNCI